MKRLLAVILTLTLLAALSIPALAANDTNVSQIIGDGNTVVFIDVGTDFWAYDNIQYAAQQGIVSGYPDGSFKPGGSVTREEFCKMMVLTFRASLQNPSEPSFTDVAPSRWSYQYIETCRDFLTGYSSPFDGTMTFQPGAAATREDIAVALVKMMGLRVGDESYAQWTFSDFNEVSPGLRPYVSAAAENGLISGYTDGTFGPQKSITRAETVTLLNRASKMSVGDASAELSLTTNVVYDTKDPKKATIYISSDEDITVTIDGNAVRMDEDYYSDGYTGTYTHTFTEEGEKTFTVVGTKGAKTKTVTVTAKYQVGAPTLIVNQANQTVTDKNFTFSGTAKDDSSTVSLTMNNESVSMSSYGGSWSKSVTLKEGANIFNFVLTNSAGKSATKTVTITFNVDGPTLTVNQADQTVSNKSFTFSGTISDDNYTVSLTMNNESVSVSSYGGSWSKSVTLKEGANTFDFTATNSAGKSVTKTVTITFSVDGPTLTVNQADQIVSDKSFTFSGTISDNNYTVSLTMNNESVSVSSYGGSWSRSVTLKEGSNTFNFTATNSAGKSVSKTVTITLETAAPTISFVNCPETTTQDSVTIIGRIGGDISGIYLFVNDQQWSVSYDGSFQKAVSLNEGENVFVFRAVNSYNKEVTVTKTITYTAP